MQRADAVTVICEGLARDVIARGIPAEKVTIIPNAVDRNAFSGRGRPDPDLAASWGWRAGPSSDFSGRSISTKGCICCCAPSRSCGGAIRKSRCCSPAADPRRRTCAQLAAELGLDSSRGLRRAGAAFGYSALLRSGGSSGLSPALDAADRAGDPAEAARGDGAGADRRRLGCRRPSRTRFATARPAICFRPTTRGMSPRAFSRRLTTGPRGRGFRRGPLQYVETERSWAHSVARYAAGVRSIAARPADGRRGDAQPRGQIRRKFI